jgi:hypothetical protein
MATRIDKLTPEQQARFDEWADRWIEVGLRTGNADRPRFEQAVRDCYRYAGLLPPRTIVWTTSPLVVALAGPIASYVLASLRRDGVVDAAVGGAVDGAVGGAVGAAVGGAVRKTIAALYLHRFWGQFGVGGWYWGGAWTSYFREIAGLELPGDLWDRARAYEATMESACWWFPHRDFVIVSERPQRIARELTDPARPRGWGSHRLHATDGPAVSFSDGWGVYAVHGVRVPAQVVERPDSLSPKLILAERNVEVRRVMLELFGMDRFVREGSARKVHVDEFGTLWRFDFDDDEPLVMVQVTNSTPESDGSFKDYWLRVPPDAATARGAIAWTFGLSEDDYAPEVMS